jgi:7-cyano-7-deazaguanine synthase in queuosine biosynthesis
VNGSPRTRLVLCGGIERERLKGEPPPIRLAVEGLHKNVHHTLDELSARMTGDPPDVMSDLFEIASYVFSADQVVTRGDATDDGTNWRRRFEFHVPVRRIDVWSRPEVTTALVDLLSFLSDDAYAFKFVKSPRPAPRFFLDHIGPGYSVDDVILFSGGLDSLGGAVAEIIRDKRRIALVSHVGATKRQRALRGLVQELSRRAPSGTVQHIAVRTSKTSTNTREYTQRTRSFFYGALAATVAVMLKRDRIRFYENGVTSMNLPIAAQVVGARASRTTHPRTIAALSRLLSALLERSFVVDSPFLWKTKTDVVKLIAEHGCSELIADSVSCSRTIETKRDHPHCGTCVQCVDRRFATLAAGVPEEADPPSRYAIDLMTGPREDGESVTMAEAFVQRARKLARAHETDFYADFGEAAGIVRHVGLSPDEAGARIFDLHRRHANEVHAALAEGHRRHADAIVTGSLPESCLLVLALPDRYVHRGIDSSAPLGSSFAREGDVWQITWGGKQASLKDAIGLKYLALLLARPGKRMHAETLLARIAGQPEPEAAPAEFLTDRRAIAAFRRRMEDLEAAIEEAKARGAPDEVFELREEHDRIQAHLRSVVGIGNRPRRGADPAERARQSVGKALHRALKRVDRAHAPLARHLRKSLRIGIVSAYWPDPAEAWITGEAE